MSQISRRPRGRPSGCPRRRGRSRNGQAPTKGRQAGQRRAGLILISPTLILVLVMVVLPILWTVSWRFSVRLINIRTAGVFGAYTLDNFDGFFTSVSCTR